MHAHLKERKHRNGKTFSSHFEFWVNSVFSSFALSILPKEMEIKD